jgi:hypothetical protein
MDWRLIAAISAAGGSFCLVAVGAYVVLTTNSGPQTASSPAPVLLSEYRFPATTSPSLVSAQALAAIPLASQTSSAPVFVTSNAAVAPAGFSTSGSAAPADPSRLVVDSNKLPQRRVEPKQEPRVTGYKTAAVTPSDAGSRAEPPRPVVEIKKGSVVPELHTALPTTRYRGVLTSAEIVRIRHNLRLTPDQEPAWPPVEAALAEMGRQQITLIRHGQEPRISQSDWPPGRLYSVAGPLLRILRPDQKDTVRRLCRSLGFENVASMI